jgi:hypothetical protein
MTREIATWLLFRALRWLAWIIFFGYSFYYIWNPAPHLDSFGQLYHSTEAVMYGSGVAAVFLGFLEIMFRERAGRVRPRFGELIPPAGAAEKRPDVFAGR